MDKPLDAVARSWTELGQTDPLWAALTESGRGGQWDAAAFLRTGQTEIDSLLTVLRSRGVAPVLGTALDFGCGPGRLTAALAASGFARAIGVDVSPTMIDKAKELVPPAVAARCEFVLNTAADLSAFETDSVDLAYTCRVLQHMPPALSHGYIREFLRVVRPGGIVAFQLPAGPAPGVAGAAVRLVPTTLLSRLRQGMQMHGTPPAEVARIVADAGGVTISIEEDASAGPRWSSYLYLAQVR